MASPNQEQREAAERWLSEPFGPYEELPFDLSADAESLACVFAARESSVRAQERERCAKLVETPYSDDIGCYGADEPLLVAAKMAAAIRALEDMP